MKNARSISTLFATLACATAWTGVSASVAHAGKIVRPTRVMPPEIVAARGRIPEPDADEVLPKHPGSLNLPEALAHACQGNYRGTGPRLISTSESEPLELDAWSWALPSRMNRSPLCRAAVFDLRPQDHLPLRLSVQPSPELFSDAKIQCGETCELEGVEPEACESFTQTTILLTGPSPLEVLVAELMDAPAPATWEDAGAFLVTGSWEQDRCLLRGRWNRGFKAAHPAAGAGPLAATWDIEAGGRPLRLVVQLERGEEKLPGSVDLYSEPAGADDSPNTELPEDRDEEARPQLPGLPPKMGLRPPGADPFAPALPLPQVLRDRDRISDALQGG